MDQKIRTYSKLIQLPTFKERLEYLKLDALVGVDTFGYDRYLNQALYRSVEWRSLRRKIVIRDNGCDLGVSDIPIAGKIIVHHMNPISIDAILDHDPSIFDPEFLITVSLDTHNAIHYGNSETMLSKEIVERRPGDTCPWK